jgi:hypothetical protein
LAKSTSPRTVRVSNFPRIDPGSRSDLSKTDTRWSRKRRDRRECFSWRTFARLVRETFDSPRQGFPLTGATMPSRLLSLACLAALAFTACKTPYKESDEKRKQERRNAAGDPNFQAFLGRLRTAVQRKDRQMLQSLMAPGFGYRWDEAPPGDNVFTYWDLNNLWPELNALLAMEFVLHETEPGNVFMVSPPELATDPNYAGYRVGMKQIMGSWKFVYFVPPPPPEQTVPTVTTQ